MNEQSITIRWDKNPDGSTDISVSVDIDGQTYFREAFLSLDMLPPLYDISETKTSGDLHAQFKQKQRKVKMREMNCKWLRMSNIS